MVSHSEDEVLSLLALGESVNAADEAHAASCPRCQSRLDQLSAVVGTARSVTPEDHPVAAPPAVWAAITAELGLAESGSGVTSIADAPSRRRSRTWLVAAAAAMVGIIVGGGTVAAVLSDQPSESFVASADLGPIADSGFTGTAVVQRSADGNVLTVSVPGLPPVDGYYEVWMATPDTTTMVALGAIIPGHEAVFTLPAGLDPDAFPVVDVSIEHFDGDTGHSAESVVRGQLQA
jgi:hypothetical protein